jgi:hypothetical protein
MLNCLAYNARSQLKRIEIYLGIVAHTVNIILSLFLRAVNW